MYFPPEACLHTIPYMLKADNTLLSNSCYQWFSRFQNIKTEKNEIIMSVVAIVLPQISVVKSKACFAQANVDL